MEAPVAEPAGGEPVDRRRVDVTAEAAELREAQIRRERRTAQKALTESELRFRTLAESAPGRLVFGVGVGG